MRNWIRLGWAAAFLTVCALSAAVTPALALDPYDAPIISCEGGTTASITLHVCGGATTGAPAGVSIQWIEKDLYDALGGQWPSSDTPGFCALSLSGQPSLQHPDKSRWELMPGECEDITIGDLNFDETGLSTNCLEPLECGTEYVFRAFAHAGRRMGRSAWTADIVCSTDPCNPGNGCTFTQGYWKTHGPVGCQTGNNSNEWMTGGNGLFLGNVHYTDDDLCAIMNKPAAGNGLISLSHQLIAAKLNLLNGSGACAGMMADVAAADALIGNLVVPPVGAGSLSPGTTSALNGRLTTFNEGDYAGCPAHCASVSQQMRQQMLGPSSATSSGRPSWGSVKVLYR
jgi:hypothetical protein